MKWIGLTGGIGTGKSTVASILRKRGYLVADADEFARQAVGPDHVIQQLVQSFGKEILNQDGTLNRGKLGLIVFGDQKKLAALENVLHPIIRQNTEKFKETAKSGGAKVAFYDVPLLFEKKMEKTFDLVVTVISSEKIQLDRLKQIRKWSDEEIQKRLAAQLSLEHKSKASHHVIINDGSLVDLEKQIDELIKKIQ